MAKEILNEEKEIKEMRRQLVDLYQKAFSGSLKNKAEVSQLRRKIASALTKTRDGELNEK